MIGSDLEGAAFDDITVKGDIAVVRATGPRTITIRATGETQPARLRQLFVLRRTGPLENHAVHVQADAGAVRRGAAPASNESATGSGHVPHPLAVAKHEAAPALRLIYLPVQGPGR